MDGPSHFILTKSGEWVHTAKDELHDTIISSKVKIIHLDSFKYKKEDNKYIENVLKANGIDIKVEPGKSEIANPGKSEYAFWGNKDELPPVTKIVETVYLPKREDFFNPFN